MLPSRVSRILHLCVLTAILAPGWATAGATAPNGPPTELAGTWLGRSLCVTSRPACTDETVRYRITVTQPDGMRLRIDADKLVNGTYLPMGPLDCQFQTQRQLLLCPMDHGQWLFRWDSETLLGSLSTTDEGVFRHIQVQRTPR